MILHQKGEVQVCRRHIAVGRALGDSLYVKDSEGDNRLVDRESVENLIAMLTGRFFMDYIPGHSTRECKGYDDYVAGSIVAFQVERDKSSAVVGYDLMLTLALMAVFLEHCLPDQKILSGFAGGLAPWRYPEDGDEPERLAFEALIGGRDNPQNSLPQDVHYIIDRYRDIENCFPSVFDKASLWFFVLWLFRKVHVSELTATTSVGKRIIISALEREGDLQKGGFI